MAKEQSGGTQTAEKKKAKTIILGYGSRTEEMAGLQKLSGRLGCKVSDLLWSGAKLVLANPPAVAPAGAKQNVGTAPGFWTVVDKNPKGKATGIRVIEVSSRGQLNASNGARTFFRYKSGDDKAKAKAQSQAMRAASSDAELMGVTAPSASEKYKG